MMLILVLLTLFHIFGSLAGGDLLNLWTLTQQRLSLSQLNPVIVLALNPTSYAISALILIYQIISFLAYC